ncbi:cytochrome P450 [Pseudohalioglobus sediminis]|nr:cytochrome P450 [Pseudohalioglobus sediminis]
MTSQAYKQEPDNRDLDHIPGSDGLPYFGRGLDAVFRLKDLADEHYRKWGEVSRIKILDQRGVLVLGADNYQRIYLDRDKNFSAEMGYDANLGQFYKGGLLLRDFEEHKFQRRIMQSAFKTAVMGNYVAEMNPIIEAHLDSWSQHGRIEFGASIKELLLAVGARVFIGVEASGAEAEALNRAFTDINEGLVGQVKKELPFTKFRKGKQGERFLARYFAELIPRRRGSDGTDMLTYMCNEKQEDGRFFDEQDIIAHASFLLFAAHDTTTSVLNHLVMYSAMDPSWQRKMRAEVESLGKDTLEYEDLASLELIDRCFHECLRLHPSVPLMTRRTIRECELGAYTIPPNTMLFLPPMFNHRDPRYWSNPDQFDPDRFLPERAEHKQHSFCYHPFGGGAHKCIGMHFAVMLAKAFMFQFLKRFDYQTPKGFKPRLLWVPLPKPARLPLDISPRH